MRPPGSVNTLSAKAAAFALRQPEMAAANAVALGRERDWLAERLTELGLAPLPSVTNFLLCRIGTPAEADAANEALLRGGIVVRTFGPDGPAGGTPALHGPESRAERAIPRSHPGVVGWEVSMSESRRGERVRETRETRIAVSVDLDGSGEAAIATGVGFYDHLLSSLAHHSLIDIEIRPWATSRSTTTTPSRM